MGFESLGKSTKIIFETYFKLISILFSIISFTFMISCSNFFKPWWTWYKYESMFIEVHVKVTIPGLNFNSKSSKWGYKSSLQMGLIFEFILSYSFKAYSSSFLYILNFSSCKRMILADSGMSIPYLSKHFASLIS